MKNLVALIAFTIHFLCACAVYAQSLPTFEVASIRPNSQGFIDLGGGARLLSGATRCQGTDTRPIPGDPLPVTPQGRCIIRNSTLEEMMNNAYGLRFQSPRPILNQMIVGGPSWTETSAFDVEAKAENSATVTNQQLLSMLQTLLVDRFKLKFHRETREASGLSLSVVRSGSKLIESKAEEQTAFTAAPAVKGTRVPIGTLVNLISQRTGRIVLDKTGLTGLYSFTLSWVPDETELAASGKPVVRNPGDPSGPSLMAALEEQLGLRLEAQKVPMEVVVIDSVQMPEAN